MNAEGRVLDVAQFAAERAQDIGALLEAVATDGVVPHVPRHLRRRAGSHRSYASFAPDKRRAIENLPRRQRRRKLGREDWMPTHRWHAKRMVMVNYLGVKVALRCNDKGPRYVSKTGSTKCLVYDASHLLHYTIALEQGKESVWKAIREMCPLIPDGVRKWHSARTEATVYGTKGNIIGPISLYSRPEDVLLCVPRCIETAVLEVMQERCSASGLTWSKTDVAHFELFGPESCRTLVQGLAKYTSSSTGWKVLQKTSNPYHLKRGIVYPLDVHGEKDYSLAVAQKPADTNRLQQCGSGLDIIVPTSLAKDLWVALVMANGHAIGMMEKEWWLTEIQHAVFPRDWAHTEAGRNDILWRATLTKKQLTKHYASYRTTLLMENIAPKSACTAFATITSAGIPQRGDTVMFESETVGVVLTSGFSALRGRSIATLCLFCPISGPVQLIPGPSSSKTHHVTCTLEPHIATQTNHANRS